MKILEKLSKKNSALWDNPTVAIAFLGDSVTQGCFEIFQKDDGVIETKFRQQENYGHILAKILGTLYPMAPIQVINAGLSGDNAPHAVKRLDRDVLRFSPDLTVVCFGLNDAMSGKEFLPLYLQALETIFNRLRENGSEVIFMTPSRMNTKVSCHLKEDWIRQYAEKTAKVQNDGTMDAFMDGARELCRRLEVPVCDCYAIWRKFYENGVCIEDLLANQTNHPSAQMHGLFATELARTIFEYE